MAKLTMLKTMASHDFVRALDRHLECSISILDLKDLVFGKRIVDLTEDEAGRARELVRERGLSVHCFSTQLFEPEIELGEAAFRQDHLKKVNHTLEIARILQPQMIRLLAAQTARRSALGAEALIDFVFDQVSSYSQGLEQEDDQTMVVVQLT